MNDINFSIREVGSVTVLDLQGRIVLGESSARLHQKLRSLVEDGKRNVVIDLKNVTTLDSSGLGTLVAGYASLERAGGRLKLCCLPAKISELMLITKLYAVFDVFDTEAAAVASFDVAAARSQSSIL
ncbi:MAG: STAS domain-containing protein [Pyrinomonadaceae bacterium]